HLRDQRRWRRAAPPDLRDCEQYTPELVRRWAMDLLQLESKRNRQIWKAPAQGGLAVQVTKSGGYEAFESPDGKLVYYSKLERPGIWRVAVEGGEETPVLGKASTGMWALAKDGIYFFDWKDVLRRVMQSYSFFSRRSTTLYEFP